MKPENNYFVLAFYTFQPITDPKLEVKTHKEFLEKLDATCRIYISEEGINGQLCLERHDAHRYIDWIHSRREFKDLEFKVHEWHEQAFPRLIVKYRKYLVGRDQDVDLNCQGEHLSPEKWKEMLENEPDALLLDIRNTYEWKVGRFKNAQVPPCEKFRDFEKYAELLSQSDEAKKKKVMMYCTGGIRCEVYSSLLKQKGFENVFQLQGGIIKYGLEQGTKHWEGKLFVFDDRLTVPISTKEEAPVIGTCHLCNTPSESYYNCANTDCNELFLCCRECLTQFKGCCGEPCTHSKRLRPFNQQNPHKPFKKKHHYLCEAESSPTSCSLTPQEQQLDQA